MAIAVDSKTQRILNVYTGKGYENDNKHFIPLVRKLKDMKFIVADKGYDSVKNREFVKCLKARPIIPYREFSKILALANMKIDKKIYHRRSIVESVFSVIKRKFGDSSYSKYETNLVKEMFLTAVTYNVYIESRAYSVRVFYRASCTIILIRC